MTLKEFKLIKERASTFDLIYEKMKSLENSKLIDWETKAKNPCLTKRQAYKILVGGLIACIKKRSELHYKPVYNSSGEELILKNCVREFGKWL